MKPNTATKKLLIVVDMIKGFVVSGNMADKKIAHIVPSIEEIIKEYIAKGHQVIYVTDCHKEGCEEFLKFPVHCLEGTDESQMIDEFQKYQEHVIVVKKNSTSAMFAPGFIEMILKMTELEEVVITGCCTDICVMNLAIPLINFFDEHDRHVTVTVPMNAVETYDASYHPAAEYNEMAFKFMKQSGINLVEKY